MSEAMREAFEALENLRRWADDHPAHIEADVERWTKAVKAALSGAQQGAAPQPAQVPEGWRLVPVEPTTEMLGEGAIALFAQSREPLSSAYRSMLAAAPRCPMLTAAPSGDAKPFTETSRPIDDAMVGLPNGSFKAFHASLCRRFGFPHDDQYWWRDLVSLEEHIAAGFGDAKREAEEMRNDAERYQWLRNRIFAADLDYGGLDAPCLIIALPKGSIFTSDANETIDAARLRQSECGDDSEEETHG